MDTLHISLFGHFTIKHSSESAHLKLPRSMQALLAYLLLHRHPVSRDVLMEVFWPDQPAERARSSLTTALWRLRQLLESDKIPSGTYLVTNSTGEIGFNWKSYHWLDSELFEQNICSLIRKPLATLDVDDAKQIEEILLLYRGELLEGMYEDWALSARERSRTLYLDCLSRLMTFYSRCNNFEQSIFYGQEILRSDPLREEIHRELMRIYLKHGQRALAVRQYVQCRDLLLRELGVPPLEETELLYQEIVASGSNSSAAAGLPQYNKIAQLARELQLVKRSLDETTRAMALITQSVNRLMGGSSAE